MELTQEYEVVDHRELLRVLEYCEMTGLFRWKVSLSNRAPVGTVTGIAKPGEYAQIRVGGRNYKGHKLAVYWYTSMYPFEDVDHRDGNKANNRIDNLRMVGTLGNNQNIRGPRSNNKIGFLGVFRCKMTMKWRATICAEGIRHHLGTFETPALAHAAYVKAKRELHIGNTL